MLDIIFLILFLVMAFRITRSLIQESAVFKEYNQSRSLVVFVLLFPFGPIALLTLSFRLGWGPAVLVALLCYIPALVVARKRIYVFERSGTDKTQRALQAANQAFGMSLLGFVYIGIVLVFIFIRSNITGITGT